MRSIAVPVSRFSYGTDDTPLGLSSTTTCASSNTMTPLGRFSGAGADALSVMVWAARSRNAGSVISSPSTRTLPRSHIARAFDHGSSGCFSRSQAASVMPASSSTTV